jgi:hypothetical protein
MIAYIVLVALHSVIHANLQRRFALPPGDCLPAQYGVYNNDVPQGRFVRRPRAAIDYNDAVAG